MPLKSKTLQFKTEYFEHTVKERSPQGSYAVLQTLKGRIIPSIMITEDQFPSGSGQPLQKKRFLHLDLGNSANSTDENKFDEKNHPSGYFDQNDIRGYYLEHLKYLAWLQKAGDAADPNAALPGWGLQQEAPDSPNNAGSISSSIGFNANASVGNFGIVPVATGGVSATFSSSHSHQIQDFTFSQHSGKNLHHEMVLSQTADGHTYKEPGDLWQSHGLFERTHLRGVPVQALSNLPICGQGVWMNVDDSALVDRLDLHVLITPRYVLYEGTSIPGLPLATGGLLPGDVGTPHFYTTDWSITFPIDFRVL